MGNKVTEEKEEIFNNADKISKARILPAEFSL